MNTGILFKLIINFRNTAIFSAAGLGSYPYYQ
jgi:hypothetical protein